MGQDRQSREQEAECQSQGCLRQRSWPLDGSSLQGSQSSECQGFRCYQEGHSTLQEGQGVLPVSGSSGSLRHQLQTWGFLRLSSGGASFSKVFGIHIDEGCRTYAKSGVKTNGARSRLMPNLDLKLPKKCPK